MKHLPHILLLGASILASAQANIPTVLTDKIQQGSGVINILKDVRPDVFADYLRANKGMFLALDVNENASGTETARTQGVAIKQMRLLLSTSDGDFSFSDFVTSSRAKIIEAGSRTASEFYTVFGDAGSNELTSATKNFDLSKLDDVITFQNINFTGEILGARLEVAFLETARGGLAGANEDFFDFTGGFEDFAILSPVDAAALQEAAQGKADAPAGITYTPIVTPLTPLAPTNPPTTDPVVTNPSAPTTPSATDPSTPTAPETGGGTVVQDPVASVPGAPAPPLLLLVLAAGLLGMRRLMQRDEGKAVSC